MKNVNVLVSFNDYLNAVDFLKRERKEQIAYLLYYVTHIAGLRKDMTPKIISHRLSDQIVRENSKYDDDRVKAPQVKENEIACIMADAKDYFTESFVGGERDRVGNETAYILTESKRRSMDKEFNRRILSVYKKKALFEKVWLGFVFVILGLLISIFTINLNNHSCVGISWDEYKIKTDFEHISNGDRATLMLYYITQVIKFRDDMTPDVLSERLYFLGYSSDSPENIRIFLDNSPYAMKSSDRKDAYKISAKGVKEIGETVGLKIKYGKEEITASWVWENVPLLTIFSFLGFFIICIPPSFTLGYKLCDVLKSQER